MTRGQGDAAAKAAAAKAEGARKASGAAVKREAARDAAASKHKAESMEVKSAVRKPGSMGTAPGYGHSPTGSTGRATQGGYSG